MLTEVQARNYSRYQKLHMYLTANTSVYSSYLPFNREAQSFITNFNVFKSFVQQKEVNAICINSSQKELKNKIAIQVANICAMATAYAEQYNDEKLAAAVNYSRNEVLRFRDNDMYELVSSLINVLEPMLTDVHFMEYDITEEILESVMTDAITFTEKLETDNWINAGSSLAIQTFNVIIQQLERNVQQLDRLINRFTSTYPGFVAGYHINTAPEIPVTYHTGLDSAISSGVSGKLISDSFDSITSKKEIITDAMGNYAIISINGCECEIMIDASGFVFKTAVVCKPYGKTPEVDIAL